MLSSEILLFPTQQHKKQERPFSSLLKTAFFIGLSSYDFHDYVLIQDRKKAIEFIINKSESNDVVILAGKGHETYQVLKTETIYFDDQEEVTKAIVHRLTKEYPLQEALT